MPVEQFKWQYRSIPAGRRNRKFTVYEQVTSPDEFGGQQKNWRALYEGWMGVRVTNAFENGEVRQQHDEETYYTLALRYNATLKTEHIIVSEHAERKWVFAIEGILEQDLSRNVMIVKARRKTNLDDFNF